MAEQQLNATQRAQLFAMSTRQNWQMLAKETATVHPSTIQFTLPKTRLLSGITLRIYATINVKHATKTELATDIFTPYRTVRKINIDLNNGFSPFSLSGEELAMYNMIGLHPSLVTPQAENESGYTYCPTKLTATSEGWDNYIAFTFELPITLNPRDPIGLILSQNEQTVITVNIDTANGGEIFGNPSGFTIELKSMTVEACVESFSIPANANALPDLSVLKLVNGRNDSMPTAGQQVIKLSTGTIYRKLIFRVLDENGEPVEDDFITSDISLVFNQADTNYSVSASMLRVINEKMLGFALPKGMFVFDFSNSGGFSNLGGSRDYIDSANLTEFWLRFNTTGKGKVEMVTETLSRLA